jgi:hypothetical protein
MRFRLFETILATLEASIALDPIVDLIGGPPLRVVTGSPYELWGFSRRGN